jgi:hypothetical protein
MPEIIYLDYQPQLNPLDDDFGVAKTIVSQLAMSIKLGLSLRQFKIVPGGLIGTLGPKGTTIRVQIILNRGQDLYEVSVGRQSRKTGAYNWAYYRTGIYCDQLSEVIKSGFDEVHGA